MHFLDRLNLRPQERRLVLGALVVLFVVLNFWFVWPHFGRLQAVRSQMVAAQETLDTYRTEALRTNSYLAQLKELETQGTGVLDEDADKTLNLTSTVQSQARQSGINYNQIAPAPRSTRGNTNEFFEQRSITVGLNATPPEPLVHFLVAIAANNLVMRVKELDLKPDPSHTKLTGTIRIVASFQKKSPTRTATAAQPTTAARPVTAARVPTPTPPPTAPAPTAKKP